MRGQVASPFPLEGGRVGDGGGGRLSGGAARAAPDLLTEPPAHHGEAPCPHPHPTLPRRGGGLFVVAR